MIYKYRSFDTLYKYDVFTRAELYFARPSEFNDPFESKPQLVGFETLKERQEYVKSYINRNFSGKKYKEKQALKKQFLIRLSNIELVKKDIHKLLDTYGIFSAAKKWSQNLMWSHYSDSHEGFCIGFDFDREFDHDMGMAHEVKYAKDYPKIGPELFIKARENNNEKLLEATLATKSIDWSYEEEVRYIKLAREGGSGVYSFDKKRLKEVIIGALTSPENRRDIIEVTMQNMPWVCIYQAKLSEAKYELYRESIKLTEC